MRTKQRRPVHPASRAIRVWLLKNDLLAIDLARALDVDLSAITHFVNGVITSQRIRDHFINLGCPESLMQDLDALREQLRRAA